LRWRVRRVYDDSMKAIERLLWVIVVLVALLVGLAVPRHQPEVRAQMMNFSGVPVFLITEGNEATFLIVHDGNVSTRKLWPRP